jgi:hypothetical protein
MAAAPAQRLAHAAHARLNALEIAFGGLEQFVALAGALLAEDRIAAGHQALAGIVRAVDLGQVALVEQRQLQGPAVLGQRPDGGGPQRGDEVEAGRDDVLIDPGLGDHAAIADEGDARQAEAGLELVDLGFER